jgi:hypothetical protein
MRSIFCFQYFFALGLLKATMYVCIPLYKAFVRMSDPSEVSEGWRLFCFQSFSIYVMKKEFLRVLVRSDDRTERILIGGSRGCERDRHLSDTCVDRLQGMLYGEFIPAVCVCVCVCGNWLIVDRNCWTRRTGTSCASCRYFPLCDVI